MWYILLMLLIGQPMCAQERQERQALIPPDQRSSSAAHFYYGPLHRTKSLHFTLKNREFKISRRILGCLPWGIGRCCGFLSYEKLHSVDLTPDRSTIVIGLTNGTVTTLKQRTKASICAVALYCKEQSSTFHGDNACVAINASGSTWASADSHDGQSTVRIWTNDTVTPNQCTINDTIEVLLIGEKTAVAGSASCIRTAQLDDDPLVFSHLAVSFSDGDHQLRLRIDEGYSGKGDSDTLIISDKQGKVLKGIKLENTPSQD